MKFRRLEFIVLIFIIGTIFSIYHVRVINAASLSISPSSGTYNIGQTFNVSVYVSSADQAMNAASAVITFPADKLQITSLSKTGSIVSLWVQEPSFSNSNGTINFEGIVLNPGFQGSNGKIITLTFKVKTAGTASLSFTSSSVLANDGQGTNILQSLGSAQFILKSTSTTEPPASEASTPLVKSGTPVALKINSPTHPNPEKWYKDNSPQFAWTLSEDITAIAFTLDQKPITVPNTKAQELVTSFSYQNLKEGIWYFHLQAKNALGWGGVSHFKIQIDATPPDPFTIQVDNEGDPTNPQPFLLFEAKDTISGVDYYQTEIGQLHSLKILPDEMKNGKYQIPITPAGEYQIVIRAVDEAGNYTITIENLIIFPIKAPIITDYPPHLILNEPLIVKGAAFTKGTVEVFIQNNRKEITSDTVKTDELGNWSYVSDKTFEKGVYALWAKMTDSRGATSDPSDAVKIIVAPPAFIKIGSVIIDYLSVINTFIALTILLALVILYGFRKLKMMRRSLKRNITEDEKALYQVFLFLRKEITNQIANLDSQPYLSDKENQILEGLKKSLDVAEKTITDIIRNRTNK
jgi:hypothetical protein